MKPVDSKKGRLIVRNINFDLREKHLRKMFQVHGSIKDVKIPLKQESNLNKGFAFVEFETWEEATKAMEAINGKKIKGRMLAVDYAVPKGKYVAKLEKVAGDAKGKEPEETPEATSPKEDEEEPEKE